ncbi:MAG: SDR family NAD(P)-dependent oxidoreductase, partial [Candidatus Aminicenantales bacterium]
MKRFEGRVSIVTGGSQGIGETIARDLAAEGARVVLVDIQKDKLEAVAGSIVESGGLAEGREVDVSDTAAVERTVAAVAAAHGRIDH